MPSPFPPLDETPLQSAPPAVTPTSTHTTLTPQFCFDTTALRDFLRLSRTAVDDSISAHLNSLLQPSRPTFNPSTTSTRPITLNGSRQNIPSSTCRDFKRGILFPSWKSRDDILAYCSAVADAPDPSSPPVPSSRSVPNPSLPSSSSADPIASSTAAAATTPRDVPSSSGSRNYWNQPQVVDERTDPYSARDYSYTREPRQEVLRDVLRNEAGVEKIVRARTWSVLGERCLGAAENAEMSCEDEWREWRRGQDSGW